MPPWIVRIALALSLIPVRGWPVPLVCWNPDGRSAFAQLLAPGKKSWNQERLNYLFDLMEFSPAVFSAALKKMEPAERFRVLAGLVAIRHDKHIRGPAGRAITAHTRDLAAEKIRLIDEHLRNALSIAERKALLADTHLLGDPYLTSQLETHQSARREAAQIRSELTLFLDSVYGLDIRGTEQTVEAESHPTPGLPSALGPADWSLARLSPNSQNTTYFDMEQIFTTLKLQRGQVVADLGAGYGRMGLYLGHHYPQSHFVGYEINPKRVAAGQAAYQRLGFKNAKLVEQDLAADDFQLPDADVFFLYDPVNIPTRIALFAKLKALAHKRKDRPIRIVCREGRGDFIDWVARQGWLTFERSVASPTEMTWEGDRTTVVFRPK